MSDVVPTEIQLGAITIRAGISRMEDGTFGDSQVHPSAVIRVDDRLDPSSAAMTVIHELLHVISDTWRLDLSERQVCCLEQAIGMMMFQNPSLMPSLQNAIRRPTIVQDPFVGRINAETPSDPSRRS